MAIHRTVAAIVSNWFRFLFISLFPLTRNELSCFGLSTQHSTALQLRKYTRDLCEKIIIVEEKMLLPLLLLLLNCARKSPYFALTVSSRPFPLLTSSAFAIFFCLIFAASQEILRFEEIKYIKYIIRTARVWCCCVCVLGWSGYGMVDWENEIVGVTAPDSGDIACGNEMVSCVQHNRKMNSQTRASPWHGTPSTEYIKYFIVWAFSCVCVCVVNGARCWRYDDVATPRWLGTRSLA